MKQPQPNYLGMIFQALIGGAGGAVAALLAGASNKVAILAGVASALTSLGAVQTPAHVPDPPKEIPHP